MFRNIAGWGLLAFGAIGALLGLLVIFGGEMGDGGTMMGIGAGLAYSGWSLRKPGGGSSDGDSLASLRDDDYYDSSDSDDDSSDSDSGSGD